MNDKVTFLTCFDVAFFSFVLFLVTCTNFYNNFTDDIPCQKSQQEEINKR